MTMPRARCVHQGGWPVRHASERGSPPAPRSRLPSSAVTTTEIRAFEPSDTEAAGRLLAGRHAAHRRAEPLLSATFEDPAAATAQVAAALADGATGAVAVTDGEVTGYLLGQTKASPTWGPNIWVESAGQAVTEAEVVRDLYAAAAPAWVAAGKDAHYALVPAHDTALVDAWFRLGFGQQHVHAIREVRDAPPTHVPGVTIRAAERRDIPVLGELDLALPRHQALAPTFSAGELPTLEEAVADWEESFDDEGFCYLVAEHEGRVIGAAVGCALEKSGRPPRASPGRTTPASSASPPCCPRPAVSGPAGHWARRSRPGWRPRASPAT